MLQNQWKDSKNWEYTKSGAEIPLSELHEYSKLAEFSPTKMVAPGAAALWMGGDLARELLGC